MKGPYMHACVLSCFSHVLPFATPWTVAHQAPLSVGFSRQEYWSGWPCSSYRFICKQVQVDIRLSLTHNWRNEITLY